MLLYQALKQIQSQLSGSGITEGEAQMEARLLLAAALDLPLRELPLHHQDNIDIAMLLPLIERRKLGEPLQYILGETEFMGLPLYALPAALIPRCDSEVLLEYAINLLKNHPAPLIADICTGGGAFAVALAHYLPHARIYAVDISAAALAVAKQNITRNQVEDRVEPVQGDLLAPLTSRKLKMDLIITNPPYIPTEDIYRLARELHHEPMLALDGGADGLVFYRRLAEETAPALAAGGRLILEHGADQQQAISQLLTAAGFKVVELIRDYGHNDRGIAACL